MVSKLQFLAYVSPQIFVIYLLFSCFIHRLYVCVGLRTIFKIVCMSYDVYLLHSTRVLNCGLLTLKLKWMGLSWSGTWKGDFPIKSIILSEQLLFEKF